MKYIITAKPQQVTVSDDRGQVAGAYISVRFGRRSVQGKAIPPEGDCPECWLGDLVAYGLPARVESEIGHMATDAARGRIGRVVLEV